MNIDYGDKEFTFDALSPSTTYYFTIYPYTNSGADINYKNEGSAPSAEATTENVILVSIESENFDDNWGNWTPISILGTQVWERDNTYGTNNTACASMTGYNGSGYNENEDWLVSPPLNLDNYTGEVITFMNAQNYNGPDLELLVSMDYDGGGNPNSANWITLPFIQSSGGFAWTYSGKVDLSIYNGNAVYVAFLFTCSNSGSATWELDDIEINGEQEYVVLPEPSNYPQQFTGTGIGLDAKLTWVETSGSQYANGYLIFAGTTSDLPMPVDGIPIQNDSDLSDGQAAVSVLAGNDEFTFTQGLQPYSTYYFVIYPFTNLGTDVNYKTDGSAPTAMALTTDYFDVVIEDEGFNASWGNWTLINVLGWQEWDRLNQYGPDNTNCAAISGYDYGTSQNIENDDWLISPPMNFTDYVHETITFYNAKNYNGPDMELKISTNYDGGDDPYSATWTSLPYIKSGGDFDWAFSGEIDISEFDGDEVYVAFHYTCTQSQSANWEVDVVSITGKQVLGINPQQAGMAAVSIFPNPADEIVNVNQVSDVFSKVEIKALSGRTLQSVELEGMATKLDVRDLSSGVYFLVFINEKNGKTHSEKLIVR
ncbi:MAG: choice-of-anchor J domain-containing protein [Bacteroidales bacterium]